MTQDLNKTVLWGEHQNLGAKCVDFAGYSMPLNYGSQIEEHRVVRTDAGVFDVSHMVVIDIIGAQAKQYFEYVLANDINKTQANQALYTCMCNEEGGIVDDLIVYNLGHNQYRIVSNAATKEKDVAWLKKHASDFNIDLKVHDDLAIISLQGPNSEVKLKPCVPTKLSSQLSELKPFRLMYDQDSKWFISRTGYTGEDGFEIILSKDLAVEFWQKLLANGISPCGLAARDTLRLEAGMALYGQDMDDTTTPLESGLAWTVAVEPATRNFIGRQKIEEVREQRKAQDVKHQMIGLILKGPGVLRCGQKVIIDDCGEGVITSGIFSPTIQKGIAIARVYANKSLAQQKECKVLIRNKEHTAEIVKYPFVRNNKIVYKVK